MRPVDVINIAYRTILDFPDDSIIVYTSKEENLSD